jgi:hypothetical protein
MQPPHPAVIAHSKLSYHVSFKSADRVRTSKSFSRSAAASLARIFNTPTNTSTCFALGAIAFSLCRISLVQSERDVMPRLRNFDTKPPSPYCYEFRSDNRLESVANAHTAADLHVRPVL